MMRSVSALEVNRVKYRRRLMDALWDDCETDFERFDFLLSGRACETGIIAQSIQSEVAMAFRFRAEIMQERANQSLKADRQVCDHSIAFVHSDGKWRCPKCGAGPVTKYSQSSESVGVADES
jgi:hypothetical protein